MSLHLDLTVLTYRLTAMLIPMLESAGMALSPDRYIRLQKLLSVLPEDMPIGKLSAVLCPVFATSAQQQRAFIASFEETCKMLDVTIEEFGDKQEKKLPQIEKEKPKNQIEEVKLVLPKSVDPKRRPLVAELDECTDPPFSWNIMPERKESRTEIAFDEEFDQILLRLRRREFAENRTIDFKASIDGTIHNAGFLAIKHRYLTRPPEYLLLVERSAHNDHRAGLFDYLYQILRANEVFVDRFFYDGDLRVCRNEKHPGGLKLNDLRERYADARLILLGTGSKLISPNTGKLALWAAPLIAWKVRALLTPLPRMQWTRKENILEKVFMLLPASLKSLQFIADAPDSIGMPYVAMPDYIKRLSEVQPIFLEEGYEMHNLQQHFNQPILCWIATCAVYPVLNYNLTLELGSLLSKALGYNLLTAKNMLDIARIPWFIEGNIPTTSRNKLLEYLNKQHPEEKQLVLGYLQKIMEENPPPRNSVAWAEYQINLALLKAKTTEIPDKETLEELRAVVKRLDRDVMMGDFVLPDSWEPFFEEIVRKEKQVDVDDMTYIIAQLKWACEMATRREMKTLPFDPKVEKKIQEADIIIASLSPYLLKRNPLLDIYVELFQLIVNGKQECFNKSKALLKKNVRNIAPEEQYGILVFLQNYAASQIRSGDTAYLGIAHELNVFGLKEGAFTKDGVLSANHYTNIINTACNAGESDWAWNFAKAYSSRLDSAIRENVTKLGKAIILFEKEDYSGVLSTLPHVRFSDTHLEIRSRSMFLRSAWELKKHLDQNDYILSYCLAFEQYLLRRDKKSKSDIITASLNFVRIFKKMITGHKSKAELIAEIQNHELLYFRAWLLKRALL